ncbi:hypothetical protein OIU83_22305 [Flavobacterium sp. LS1R49]|uniref:Uncharacterized protein n=2 Tax=Flavobacterium shii TaxID=2987687 RepID=A0A9X2YXX4_9FLAO|nr:hypothetical protein [Flavobacterium shii]
MKRIIFLILIVCLSCKSKEISLINEYKNQALHDIKTDSVKIFTYGLLFIYPDSLKAKKQLLKQNKMNSIYKKYGLFKQNQGCVIGDKKMNKAIKEYHKITDVYLEKRNSKDWKEKMQKELDSIIKNSLNINFLYQNINKK